MSSPTRRTSRIKATAVLFSAAMILVVSGPGTQGASAEEPTADDSVPSTGDAGSGAGQFQELYDEVASLEGEEALAFFRGSVVKGRDRPGRSSTSSSICRSPGERADHQLFQDEGFESYMAGYPRGEPFEGFQWEQGSGTEIVGPFSERDAQTSVHRLRADRRGADR